MGRPGRARHGVRVSRQRHRPVSAVRVALPGSVSARGRWGGKLGWAATVSHHVSFAVLIARLARRRQPSYGEGCLAAARGSRRPAVPLGRGCLLMVLASGPARSRVTGRAGWDVTPVPCASLRVHPGDGRSRAGGRGWRRVTRASGPQSPGVRLGRLSRVRLGGSYGRVQVGSHFGHDLLGAADPRRPAAFAAGAALAGVGWARRSDGDLVPGDLRVDGDGHGHLRSVGYGRTYSLGEPEANSRSAPGRRSVAVAWSRRGGCRCWSQRWPGCAGRAGEPQRAHLSATGQARRVADPAYALAQHRVGGLSPPGWQPGQHGPPPTAARAAGSPSSRRRGRSRQAQQAARLPSRRAVGFSGRRLGRSSR